jgi:hypothetical protein
MPSHFLHRSDGADWDSADLMTRRDARELIRRKEMNRDNHRRSGSRSGSVNRGTARDHSVNSRRNREPAEPNAAPKDAKEVKATPVPAPSSRTESVNSGGNSEFVLDCMVVIGNVSNLACVGETTIS